jgi:hypothetical protein
LPSGETGHSQPSKWAASYLFDVTGFLMLRRGSLEPVFTAR